jgi:hypothetical protein
MRILIEIDGDRVTIHRSDGTMPPSELLERAAAIGAEGAGAAPVLGAEALLAPLGRAALDAGAASGRPGKTKAAAAPARPRRRSKPRAR